MKKVICIFIVVAILFAFCSCSPESVINLGSKPQTSDVVDQNMDFSTPTIEEKGYYSIGEFVEDERLNSIIGTHLSYKITDVKIYNTIEDAELSADDILMYEIDQNMIEDYELWLQKDGLAPNSTSFYMRILHTILNKAVRQSLIPSCDFFQNVYTGIATTTKRAIGIDSLKRIKTLDLRLFPQLDFARDMFFLSLYFRGMSFIDMANLQHKNLQNGHLVYCRQKTGQRLDIKWERQMTDILDKYSTDAKYLLPILKTPDGESRKYYKNMSKQVNRWLKKIGTMADIQIPLTMYVARHTWASLAKQKNIPLNVISDGLGHDSEKTTLIYLSTLDTSAVDDANSKILADLL